MDSNLTLSTLNFKMQFSDQKAGSVRRDTSRGVNLPTVLTIKHQDVVLSSTKLPTSRSLVRVDMHLELEAEAKIAPVSVYVVAEIPKSASVTATHVNDCATLIAQALFGATNTNGLDLKEEIFVNKEQ